MENAINLRNKKVLVTGGGQGIGASICEKMAMCGAHVLINCFGNKNKAESLAERLRQQYGIKAFAYEADISNENEIVGLFGKMDELLGGIDILVNNAGCESIDHAISLGLEDWDRIMNVNLRGAFICSQQAGKRMVVQNKGVIINISSIHDKIPRKGLVHYCASKAAMNMMSKCLALELAENNIRVVTVSPGAVETEMNREEINRFGREKFNQWIPLGKVGKVDDVAWTTVFLASDMAAYCTGTEIYIDGGYKENTIPYDPRPALRLKEVKKFEHGENSY